MDKVVHSFFLPDKVAVPSSKSYAIRALIAGLLSEGKTVLENISYCSDIDSAITAIDIFGAMVKKEPHSIIISSAGIQKKSNKIECGESGLLSRLCTCIAALIDTETEISVSGSLKSRPTLIPSNAFEQLGMKFFTENNFFPVRVKGPIKPGTIVVDETRSSQFISGLLMTLPLLEHDSTLIVKNAQSIPYIDLTLEVMKKFSVFVEHTNYCEFKINGCQKYQPCNYFVEGDWSGAAFFLVAAAVNGNLELSGLNNNSLQADKSILTVLNDSGADVIYNNGIFTVKKNQLKAFSFNATHCPDLIPPLVCLAASCKGTSVIKGTSRLIYKESNRINSLIDVFTKLGTSIHNENDCFFISSGNVTDKNICIDSYHDHRIAMAAAIRAIFLKIPITIQHAECVNKSFPDFFSLLKL